MSERPQNLNPTGISYSDCIRDMTLQFNVYLSGFAGQNLQIWATTTGMCSDPAARGQAMIPTCWQVAGGLTSVNQAGASYQFNIRVQDLVGPQVSIPNPPVLIAGRYGPSACSTQATSAPVPFTIWFVPVDGNGANDGTPYSYPISVDLVGPAPPVGVTAVAGDTLIQVNWTPNSDADTNAYDLYINPIPGQSTLSTSDAATYMTVCPDSGAGATSSTSSDATADVATDVAADAPDDVNASTDVSVSTEASASTDSSTSSDAASSSNTTSSDGGPSDGGCRNVPIFPVVGQCNDPLLTQGVVSDGGGTTIAATTDDAGDQLDAANFVSGGGISTIPTANLVNADGLTSVTVSSEGVGSYNVTGLTNGPTYNVVVAAVDGFGNIGPPSVEKCAVPAPVKDFFKTYRMDGGRAGGGFCALENVGAAKGIPAVSFGFTALAFGLARRRQRRRRKE